MRLKTHAAIPMWLTHQPAKRFSDSIDYVAVEHGEAGQASVTKPNRAVRVKIEPKDTKVV
jgi:hypothetical protein